MKNVYPNLVLATGVGAPPPPTTFTVMLTALGETPVQPAAARRAKIVIS